MNRTITLSQFRARLRSLTAGQLRDGLVRLMTKAAFVAESEAKLNATTRLHVRSGRLRASIGTRVGVSPTTGRVELELHAGGVGERGNVRYAAIHEYGGEVRPRSGGALRIPLSGGPALTGAGVDRFPPPLRQTGGGAGFFLLRSKGRAFLARRAGGRTEFWYVLSRRPVRIRARPYLRPAIARAADYVGGGAVVTVRSLVLGETVP